MPLNPEELDALDQERAVSLREAREAWAEKRGLAVRALEALCVAEREHLLDPENQAAREVADAARQAYAEARQAFRAAVTAALNDRRVRVQAKIDELSA